MSREFTQAKLTVVEYVAHSDFHRCTDEHGETVRIDLLVCGHFPTGTTPQELVGKTFDVRFHPYQYVADEVEFPAEQSSDPVTS